MKKINETDLLIEEYDSQFSYQKKSNLNISFNSLISSFKLKIFVSIFFVEFFIIEVRKIKKIISIDKKNLFINF